MGFFDSLFGKKQEQPKPETTAAKEEAFTLPEEYRDLTPRDNNRPVESFIKNIENTVNQQKENISKYENKLRELGLKYKGTVTTGLIRNSIYRYVYNCYSVGKKINNEWIEFYTESFPYYLKGINKNTVYDDNFKIISIGILLGVEASYFQKVSEKFMEEGYRDRIIGYPYRLTVPKAPCAKNSIVSR